MYEAILGKVDAVTTALGLGRESHRVLPGDNPWGYYSGGSGEASTPKQEQTSSSFQKDGKSEAESARSSLTLVEKAEVGRS